jgi:hypothetical protein
MSVSAQGKGASENARTDSCAHGALCGMPESAKASHRRHPVHGVRVHLRIENGYFCGEVSARQVVR